MNILLRMFIAVKLLVENRISSPQDLIDGTALFLKAGFKSCRLKKMTFAFEI